MCTYKDFMGDAITKVKRSRAYHAPKEEVSCIDTPRYDCEIHWYVHPFDDTQNEFRVHFFPKNKHESSFDKSLAEFLHFYDNPNGVFRLEMISFQFQ
jgi:hypothetical protein